VASAATVATTLGHAISAAVATAAIGKSVCMCIGQTPCVGGGGARRVARAVAVLAALHGHKVGLRNGPAGVGHAIAVGLLGGAKARAGRAPAALHPCVKAAGKRGGVLLHGKPALVLGVKLGGNFVKVATYAIAAFVLGGPSGRKLVARGGGLYGRGRSGLGLGFGVGVGLGVGSHF
tara:strand:- start:14069 stop:14599 length:531 start_codon:yes stop_codon:yes gene_type:complete